MSNVPIYWKTQWQKQSDQKRGYYWSRRLGKGRTKNNRWIKDQIILTTDQLLDELLGLLFLWSYDGLKPISACGIVSSDL